MNEYPMTPREIVSELDRYIVGQAEAKRAVAIALRNRWRRLQVDSELREEIVPKNIIMIGPTGVGKTEISRRLAKLADAPFVKVEATRFTEVGYVGRDVESIIRDLTELAISMVEEEEKEKVQVRAAERAEERVLDALLPGKDPSLAAAGGPASLPENDDTREKLRRMLRDGALDDREVDVEPTQQMPMLEILGPQGMDDATSSLKDSLGSFLQGMREPRQHKVKVPEALEQLTAQEAEAMLDRGEVATEAIRRVEESGIVFIDEIDKICGRDGSVGADVSREGVQRDLLPIVEGSTIKTRHGMVKSDHVLFIASGAFNVAKPADLIPEFQGRFPVRVELNALDRGDFVRILTEPRNALTRQYSALLETENVELVFEASAIDALAGMAAEVNERSENVGARRLHTLLERLLDEISFEAPERSGSQLLIDADYVNEKLSAIVEDQDLSRYIL